jgi:hypothetical protein
LREAVDALAAEYEHTANASAGEPPPGQREGHKGGRRPRLSDAIGRL